VETDIRYRGYGAVEFGNWVPGFRQNMAVPSLTSESQLHLEDGDSVFIQKFGSEIPEYMVSQSNINTAMNTPSVIAACISVKA
jgi:hypothetical protein